VKRTANKSSCADLTRQLDALFVNAPLRDYTLRPRVNDFTLPMLGMAYIATYAARRGFNVRPALRAGYVVLCDRYVPTSLVLQRMDGVENSFLWQLNQYAEVPDLTIILTSDPVQSRARAHQRGTYSRFHRGDGSTEARLYRTVARELAEAGWPVVHHEVADDTAETVAAGLLATISERLAERSG
jgi:thymidylate kinase